MAVVFLQRIADGTGLLAPQQRAIKLPGGWTTINHPLDSLAGAAGDGEVTGYTELVPPTTMGGGAVAEGAVRGVVTVGAASATLLSLPVPADAAVLLTGQTIATGGGGIYVSRSTILVTIVAGAVSLIVPMPFLNTSTVDVISYSVYPLPPLPVLPTWGGGNLILPVAGPGATITGAANNGSGKVRITLDTTQIQSSITGLSLDISGVVGTVEANGTHVATYVDASHVDLAAVAFVNAYVSGGAVALHTAPTLTWCGWARALVAS